MLTHYPERFGALFCTIPLIDMRRYAKLHAGASWIAEYGDPEKPEDWEFIKTFSPYHLLEPNRRYPPVQVKWFVSGRNASQILDWYEKRFARGTRFVAYGRWERDNHGVFYLKINKPDELEILPSDGKGDCAS